MDWDPLQTTWTGLSDEECWDSVFRQKWFADLLQCIVWNPVDLVMLQLKRCER